MSPNLDSVHFHEQFLQLSVISCFRCKRARRVVVWSDWGIISGIRRGDNIMVEVLASTSLVSWQKSPGVRGWYRISDNSSHSERVLSVYHIHLFGRVVSICPVMSCKHEPTMGGKRHPTIDTWASASPKRWITMKLSDRYPYLEMFENSFSWKCHPSCLDLLFLSRCIRKEFQMPEFVKADH